MVVGYKNRHGFIISMANSRKRLGKHVTKGDFQKMMAEYENMCDGNFSDDNFSDDE